MAYLLVDKKIRHIKTYYLRKSWIRSKQCVLIYAFKRVRFGVLAERSIAPDCKSGLNSTVVQIHHTPPYFGGLVYLANTPGLQPGANGSNPLSSTKFRSQSVHGRTRHCHCRRRGSLPLGTAKF